MTAIQPPTFEGDDRFTIRGELGRGGMGVVYEAFDRLRGVTVALKTLSSADAGALYRFKKEFRTLADVAHPNLVSLYELFARGDSWFFTMELVRGGTFLDYARPGFVPSDDPAAEPTGTLHLARLRSALRQLVGGVTALHQAGKVHRDLKPSNVLVTDEGRVVILDFGIAEEFRASAGRQTAEGGIWGTAAYMAPEQAAGETSGPPTDWYAVGAILYEALTGRLPFAGPPVRVLVEKQARDPVWPQELMPDQLPEELARLSIDLMARRPELRPDGPAVLRRLGVGSAADVLAPRAAGDDATTLVGRASHLIVLEDAFATAARGRPVTLTVYGASGIGKSVLVQRFLDGLAGSGRALVLEGRCYLRESVPYKAFDGVIDGLSRYLRGVPDRVVRRLLPDDAAALARVFPVLRRVGAFERRSHPPTRACPGCGVHSGAEAEFCSACGRHLGRVSLPDRRELRRRAFSALRQLLANLACERALAIHIDDLQWCDQDSIDLLEALVWEETCPLLLILSFRSEDMMRVPYLRSQLERPASPTRAVLEVGPISDADARALIDTSLGKQGAEAVEAAHRLVRQAQGNPFLIDQVVRFILHAGETRGIVSLDLGEVLSTRIRQMSSAAQQLVSVLAVAGRPIDVAAACRAAGLKGDEQPVVNQLEVAHVLRAVGDANRIELYHDQIRESQVEVLDADETRDLHRRLAEAIEATGGDDPDMLFEHHREAGNRERAAEFAVTAAERAQAALAFERAATLYRGAIDLRGADSPAQWHAGLGDALASAGRGREAAQAYLAAAAGAGPAHAPELERRAGEQLLISGRLEEGLEVLGRLLRSVGLRLAASPRRALLQLVLRRLRLLFRGRRFHERAAHEVSTDVLTRIDICWAVAEGLALVDNVQGAAFQTLHLLLALDAGEPHRIARALAIEAGFTASAVSPERAEGLLSEAERLAQRLGSRSALGLCALIRSVVVYYQGRGRPAADMIRGAEEMLATQLSFAAWQLSTARIYRIHILAELGEVDELCNLSRGYLEEAIDHGNLFQSVMFRTGWSCLVWLRYGDLAGAEAALAAARAQCPAGIFNIPDFECEVAGGLIDLYAGEPARAYRRLTGLWPRIEKSMLLRVKTIRIHTLHLRGRSALAAAATGAPATLLRVAERDAARIARAPTRGRRALGTLLRAGCAATRGNLNAAVQHLCAAIEGFEASEMALWLAVARRRQGELLGGVEGDRLKEKADAWMAHQGIAHPERIAAMLAPGLDRRGIP